MVYNLKFNKTTSINIFNAIIKYFEKYGDKDIKKHFAINIKQFMNIYQQMDVGNYKDFEDMYKNFNREVGTKRDITIGKNKYKQVILLLLAYQKNLIEF